MQQNITKIKQISTIIQLLSKTHNENCASDALKLLRNAVRYRNLMYNE